VVFNPEHDLALANGDPHYMPSAAVRQMVTDLALLPVWYAPAGSSVLAPSAYNLEFLGKMQEHFPHLPLLCTAPEVATCSWKEVSTWGWDAAIKRRLELLGVSLQLLPDTGRLELLRHLSHRLQAVRVLSQLTGQNEEDYLCGESHYLADEKEIGRFVEQQTACVLKAPLSGSGKGLNWCKGVFTPHIRQWCARVVRRQGGVVAEPVYRKQEDFAMGFRSDGAGRVTFCNYSLFHTTASGAYEGNNLLSDAAIEQHLSVYVPVEVIRKIRSSLEEELSVLVGKVYTGYLGVDMMICCFSTAPFYRVHPCVEINLRMSMGYVAHLLYDTCMDPASTGSFRIEYYPSSTWLREAHEKMNREQPAVVSDSRLVSGYLPLVPITPQSRYMAWIMAQPTLSE